MLPFVTGETPKNILSLAEEISIDMIEEAEELEKKKESSREVAVAEVLCLPVDQTSISSPIVALKTEHSQVWMKGGGTSKMCLV